MDGSGWLWIILYFGAAVAMPIFALGAFACFFWADSAETGVVLSGLTAICALYITVLGIAGIIT